MNRALKPVEVIRPCALGVAAIMLAHDPAAQMSLQKGIEAPLGPTELGAFTKSRPDQKEWVPRHIPYFAAAALQYAEIAELLTAFPAKAGLESQAADLLQRGHADYLSGLGGNVRIGVDVWMIDYMATFSVVPPTVHLDIAYRSGPRTGSHARPWHSR